MAYFLCSRLGFYVRSEEGGRYPVKMDDENRIVTNIKKHLPKTQSAVFVTNGWREQTVCDTQLKFQTFCDGMRMSGLDFERFTLLDFGNARDAKEVIGNADLVYLTGGKVDCAMEFYSSMNFGELLKDHKGVVIGVSAGAMVQCQTIFDFPETMDDVFAARFREGLGLERSLIFVPHFDGETNSYQGLADRDVVNEGLLPHSKHARLTAFPNGAYAIATGGKTTLHGNVYQIHNGKVTKINTATKTDTV